MKIDWKGFWQATKEPLRYVVLAIIPFFITYLLSINNQWAILATLVLRGIDSYLHDKEPIGVSGGLTRF
jgi:hypothetical protein